MTPDQYKKVKAVFDSKNIPEYVWNPIMMSESGGDPNRWNNPAKNGGKEDSRGLFQINLKAHPQWRGVNLYDPVINAELAADHFIGPAFVQATRNAGLSNKSDITAYVWKNGIRPKWTEGKNKSIRQKVADFLSGKGENPTAGAVGSVKDAVTQVTSGGGVTGYIDGMFTSFKNFSWNLIPILVGLIILILVLYSMFLKAESGVITSAMGGKK